MKVLVVRQIHSSTSSYSSNDTYVCREAEVTEDLHGEDEFLGHPVAAIYIEKGMVQVYLQGDKTFYGRRGPNPLFSWDETEEYKALVQKYLADGWSKYEQQ